jgi:hypothetical protein
VGAEVKATFSTIFWGAEHPSRRRRIAVSIAFVVLALFFVGFFAGFIPSAVWNRATIAISMTLASITLLWMIYQLSHRKLRERWMRDLMGRIWGAVAITLMAFWFSWVPLAEGLGYAFTLAMGEDVSRQVWLRKNTHSVRLGCRYGLEGKALGDWVPGYLCISSDQYRRLPAEAMYTLYGSQSWFGFISRSWRMEHR